jgi:hypothetical protein
MRSTVVVEIRPVAVGRVGYHGFRFSSLPFSEAREHVLCGHGLLAHARRRCLHAYDHATLIVDQIVVVVSHSCRRTSLGGVGGIGVGRRDLVLLMHRLCGGVLLLQFDQVLAYGWFTCAASVNCSRGIRLSFAALASTKLPSTERCFPCTNPTSTHWRTICANNSSNSFDS